MPQYTARIDTYIMYMQTIEDAFENSIAEYTYPFTDGAALDYMGEGARKITFDCYFIRSNYENHHAFLNHIRSGLLYELVHPKYGSIMGRISSPRVRHDDRKECAIITINFIEQKLGDEIPSVINLTTQVENAYQTGMAQAMDSFGSDVETELGPDAKGVLGKTIDFDIDIPLLTQFSDMSGAVRSMIADMDRMLGVLDYYLDEIAQPADAIVGAIDFGTRLPGRIVGSVAHTIERIAEAKRSVESAPSSFASSFEAAANELQTAVNNASEDESTRIIIGHSIAICIALSCGLYVGYLYDANEQLQAAYEKNMEIDAFDFSGRRIATVDAIDLYSANELENSLYLTRKLLMTGLSCNRENMAAIKTMAGALENHVTNIKLQRDRIKTVDTGTVIMPVHILCLQNGLPHRYIDRIMAINDIPNPTFAGGEIKIYERP